MSDYQDKADRIRNNWNTKREQIQSNKDLNESAKQRQLSELREKYQNEMDNLRQDYRSEPVQRRDQLKKELFSVGNKLSDTETDKLTRQMVYRDAVARAEAAATDRLAMQQLLSSAQITGDTLLLKAIAMVSTQTSGFLDLAKEALGEQKAKKLDELLDLDDSLENPTSKERFAEGALFILD
ncbi:MAG TPA: hypothetical protein VGB02_03300 [Pyrinomonadaceae bacterium]|jgi:hypothetical protein